MKATAVRQAELSKASKREEALECLLRDGVALALGMVNLDHGYDLCKEELELCDWAVQCNDYLNRKDSLGRNKKD